MHIGRNAQRRQRHPYARARQRAEAVKAMHHRQHRFVHRLFDGGPLDVNGHFRRTKAAAKYLIPQRLQPVKE